MLSNRIEKKWIKELKNPNRFIDYSQTIDDVYENLEDFNPTKKMRVLTVSENMIADMESNNELNTIVTKLILWERKLSISLVSVSQSYFKVPKTMRLIRASYFIMKIPNKRERQQITSNHLFDIDFKYFIKLYKDY